MTWAFMLCRLIVGDDMDVKAALGMPNVALHADATPGYDSSWCSNADIWPEATSSTGKSHSALSWSV